MHTASLGIKTSRLAPNEKNLSLEHKLPENDKVSKGFASLKNLSSTALMTFHSKSAEDKFPIFPKASLLIVFISLSQKLICNV